MSTNRNNNSDPGRRTSPDRPNAGACSFWWTCRWWHRFLTCAARLIPRRPQVANPCHQFRPGQVYAHPPKAPRQVRRTHHEQAGPVGSTRTLAAKCFTLLELMVVLVIMAIVAMMVVPYAVSASSFQAQSAARIIMADLEYAQNNAIVMQSPVTVTFVVSDNSYSVSNESGLLIHPITKQAYVVDFDTSTSFQNVSLSSANFGSASTVTFDTLGGPDNGGTVRVDAGQYAYIVTVAPVSGRVTIAMVQ